MRFTCSKFLKKIKKIYLDKIVYSLIGYRRYSWRPTYAIHLLRYLLNTPLKYTQLSTTRHRRQAPSNLITPIPTSLVFYPEITENHYLVRPPSRIFPETFTGCPANFNDAAQRAEPGLCHHDPTSKKWLSSVGDFTNTKHLALLALWKGQTRPLSDVYDEPLPL